MGKVDVNDTISWNLQLCALHIIFKICNSWTLSIVIQMNGLVTAKSFTLAEEVILEAIMLFRKFPAHGVHGTIQVDRLEMP